MTLSARLVDLMKGYTLVASLGGSITRKHNEETRKGSFPEGACFPGTLVALTFRRSQAADFSEQLQQAKDLDLDLRGTSHSASFRP